MSYRIDPTRDTTEELRRVASEQLEKALQALDEADDDLHESVHEVRKRCKKVRGLLRLFRGALGDTYGHENRALRDCARLLSRLRDATAHLETLARLDDDPDPAVRAAVGSLRRSLEDRRDALVEDMDVTARLGHVRRDLLEVRERSETWSPDARGFEALGSGLRKSYRRGREAMRTSFEDPSPERFHEWRKRSKYHRYHLALLREAWPGIVVELRDEAHRLTDLLGDDHDLAVLAATISEEDLVPEPGQRLPVLEALLRRRRGLQAAARPLGMRLFAESPKAMSERLGRYFEAARAEEG